MLSQLAVLRESRVESQWVYLAESLRLEARQDVQRQLMPSDDGLEKSQEIDRMLMLLEPRDSAAITAVLRFEIDSLLFWCRLQATTIPLKRRAGLL